MLEKCKVLLKSV